MYINNTPTSPSDPVQKQKAMEKYNAKKKKVQEVTRTGSVINIYV